MGLILRDLGLSETEDRAKQTLFISLRVRGMRFHQAREEAKKWHSAGWSATLPDVTRKYDKRRKRIRSWRNFSLPKTLSQIGRQRPTLRIKSYLSL